jgi:hypothetical protein
MWAFLLSIANLTFAKDRKLFTNVEGLTWTFWQHSTVCIVTVMWSVHNLDGEFVPGKEFYTQRLTYRIGWNFFKLLIPSLFCHLYLQVLECAITFIFLQMPPSTCFPKIVIIQHFPDKKFCICHFPMSEVIFFKFY